jgi:hypothetical protein
MAVGSGNCEVSSLAPQRSTFDGCDVGEVAGVDAAEEPQVPVIQVPGPGDLGSLTNEVGRAQGLHHPSLPSQTFFRRGIRGCSARRELLPCRSPSPTSAKRRYGPGRGGRRGRRQLPTRARAVFERSSKRLTVGIAGVRGGCKPNNKTVPTRVFTLVRTALKTGSPTGLEPEVRSSADALHDQHGAGHADGGSWRGETKVTFW